MSQKIESKQERFSRLAEARLEKTVKQINLIANLSSKINYDYSPDQAEDLLDRVQEAVLDAREEFGLARIKVTPEETLTLADLAMSEENLENDDTPSNESNDIIESVEEHNSVKLEFNDYANAAWALDMLMRKDYKDAKELLTRIVKNSKP